MARSLLGYSWVCRLRAGFAALQGRCFRACVLLSDWRSASFSATVPAVSQFLIVTGLRVVCWVDFIITAPLDWSESEPSGAKSPGGLRRVSMSACGRSTSVYDLGLCGLSPQGSWIVQWAFGSTVATVVVRPWRSHLFFPRNLKRSVNRCDLNVTVRYFAEAPRCGMGLG